VQERSRKGLNESPAREIASDSGTASGAGVVVAEHPMPCEPLQEVIQMSNTSWRARREAYLRDSGRTVDLIREGFIKNGLAVIDGGGRCGQVRKMRAALIVVTLPATRNKPPSSIQRKALPRAPHTGRL
jgi:hypothetical protein